MVAPVVLFVYKRLSHTKNVITSLSQNIESKETILYIYSDAEKNINERKDVSLVRQYIHQVEWQKNFKEVIVIEAKKHNGLAKSIIDGVSQIIEIYKKIIVLEDDLILSNYFLKYMNNALEFYQNKDNIWSISGYSFPMKSIKKYPHDIYLGYRGCSWGWATWEDRWKKVDWDITVYDDFIRDKKWMRKFNRGGNDLTQMLKMQMNGELDSWAIRWSFTQSNLDMFTVYPRESLVENRGHDGTGTHCGNTKIFDTVLANKKDEYRFEELSINKKIMKEFWRKNSDTLNKKMRRGLKKILKRRDKI